MPEAEPSETAVTFAAADEYLYRHQQRIYARTDRLLAGLLEFEWLACILLAAIRSPLSWSGLSPSLHPHLLAATMLGGFIVTFPVILSLTRPGSRLTRHAIAAAQILMSGLLIHIGDGRIEMHFHVFGSLAFIAFYRDWRVLCTASLVAATYHLLGGMYAPQSVYSIGDGGYLRSLEHAGWVVFEDIFLIASCVQAVNEMRHIAENRAKLEQSYRQVELTVQQRTAELKSAQAELVNAARSAGMAEIATSVLHNVGNVLNSVNVSSTVIAKKLRESEVSTLGDVDRVLQEQRPRLAEFLTEDARGKMIPEFITTLAGCLQNEHREILGELESLTTGIAHIKQIVADQQSMAKTSNVLSVTDPKKLFDTALRVSGLLNSRQLKVARRFDDLAPAELDEHKIVQILVNLMTNAQQALDKAQIRDKMITLDLSEVRTERGPALRWRVSDNGMGISSNNLSRIFSHGFTTRADGHGFGLHGAANAAREMGGSLTVSSEGSGRGASFTLEIPLKGSDVELLCH